MEFVSGSQTALQLPIEDWVETRFTLQYARNNNINQDEIVSLKEKILRLFNAYGWYVINPPGDGFCGIYLANIAYEMSRSYVIDYISPIVCPNKEFLFKNIITGIELYRATYIKLQSDLKKYLNSSIEQIDYLLRLEDAGTPVLNITDLALNKPIVKMLIDMYRSMKIEHNITFDSEGVISLDLEIDFTDDGQHLNKYKAEDLKKITLYGDVDIQILYFLAYTYRHNYIVLQYNTIQQIYPSDILYAADELYRLNKNYIYHLINFNHYEIGWHSGHEADLGKHKILFNSRSEEEYKSNTTILFNDRHFTLIHNIDKTVTESLIKEFMQPYGERLWKGTAAFDIQRGFFRVAQPLYDYISGRSRGRGIRSKRLKPRQLKQHKHTLKYIHKERQSKLRTLKLKKFSKSKAKQSKAKQSKAKQSKAKQSKAKQSTRKTH